MEVMKKILEAGLLLLLFGCFILIFIMPDAMGGDGFVGKALLMVAGRVFVPATHYAFILVNGYVLYIILKGFYGRKFDDEKLYHWLLFTNFINILIFVIYIGSSSEFFSRSVPVIGFLYFCTLILAFFTSAFKCIKIMHVASTNTWKMRNLPPLLPPAPSMNGLFGHELKASKSNKFFGIPLWASFSILTCVMMVHNFGIFLKYVGWVWLFG